MSDRSTYRMQEDQQLIEEAKYNPNRELAIALGERLEDLVHEMDLKIGDANERASDFERDANKLDDKIYELRVEIDKLEMQLTQREDEVAHLRDQLNKLKKEA